MVQKASTLPLLIVALIATPAAAQLAPTPAAETLSEASPEQAAPTATAAPAETQALASRFTTPALGDTELGQASGRADLSQDARTNQVAGVSGSSVNGTSRTGAVTIDGNAFQNMSGLTVVNANSGNNVAMNGAMTVNVAITPKP